MKEWVLEYTNISEERYDSLINSNLLNQSDINQKVKEDLCNIELSDNPLVKIEAFTYRKPNMLRCLAYGIKLKDGYYNYKNIEFKILAEELKQMRKKAYGKSRYHTCFDKCFEICCRVPYDCKIVTAMCTNPFVVNPNQYIHSFITMEDYEGKCYALDGTMNTIIEKTTYLKLLKANVISEISNDKVINILTICRENNLGDLISGAEYLCFSKEIM